MITKYPNALPALVKVNLYEPQQEQLQLHAAQASPSSAALRIEDSLMRLSVGQQVYIDVDGNLHDGKSSFASGRSEILFTAQCDADGKFTIFPSLPPRSTTYVGSGDIPLELKQAVAPLVHSICLNSLSNDWVSLTDTYRFRIPQASMSLDTSRAGPAMEIENLIAAAKPGEKVFIGRNSINGLAQYVSRVHVTVEILSKELMADGRLDLAVRVWRGKPSQQQVSVIDESGVMEPVTGPRSLSIGSKLYCGTEIGIVRIPANAYTTLALTDGVYRKIKNAGESASQQMLATMIKPNERGEFSVLNAPNSRSYNTRADAERAVKISVLEHFIRDGVEMMSMGRNVEAMKHFRAVEPLQALGYDFSENHVFSLHELSERAAVENLQRVAADSWFMGVRGVVYPSFGILAEGLKPTNEQEELVLSRWQRELANIYAEEWTHGLQHARGEMISKKAALISGMESSHEADVALFLHELGVPLSRLFVTKRYESRHLAFLVARGVQTPQEQLLLQGLFDSLPVNASIRIGSEHTPESVPNIAFKLARFPDPKPDEMSMAALAMRMRAARALKNDLVTIRKEQDGQIGIDCSARTKVFVPDKRGFYYEARDRVTTEPGAPFYVGKYFRFSLS